MSTPGQGDESAKQHSREVVAGLAKGLAIIELFDGTRAQMTAAEAAREIGTSRATARRCLLTLEELGYVTRCNGQAFAPSARMSRLGRGYKQPPSLAEGAQPLLDGIRDELQEPAAFTVLDGVETLVIARAEASRIVTTGVRPGGRLPAYCSATGRVLMSELSEAALRALLKRSKLVARTPKTCTAVDEIVERVKEVRSTSVAYSDEEIEMGMRSMAVPIHGPDGLIKAALSVSTSSARTTLQQMEKQYLPVLMRNLKYFEALLSEVQPASGTSR